jgi:SagB-type dehydrogenase family enzyme
LRAEIKLFKKFKLLFLFIAAAVIAGGVFAAAPILPKPLKEDNFSNKKGALPPPIKKSNISVEEALSKRRSVRDYKDEPLTLKEVSQLLWAAQGITAGRSRRTAPSAGALYPLEVYLVIGKVKGLDPGIYHYDPAEHSLTKIVSGDKRADLFNAGLGQSSIKAAPIDIVICAEYGRTTIKYMKRGERYAHMEAGHVGQNIYLQAETLGLKCVVVGAFEDGAVKNVLGIKNEEPLYIIPVGKPRT